MDLGLFVLVGVVAVVVAALVAYAEHRRVQRLRAECLSRGWHYRGSDPSLVHRWTQPPFGVGQRRRVRHVVSDALGDRFLAFEYSYTQSSGSGSKRRSSTYTFGVVSVPLPVPLPVLVVEPEGFLDRIAGAVGLVDDIDLESEAFNQAFSVRSDSRKFAFDVLHPRHLEQLLSSPRCGWWIEEGTIVTASSGSLELADIDDAVAMLTRVVDQIPDFVWRDRGYDPERSS